MRCGRSFLDYLNSQRRDAEKSKRDRRERQVELKSMIQGALAQNDLSGQIIGGAIEVHRILGPGLLESIYQEALALELTGPGLQVRQHTEVPVRYKERVLGAPLRLDMLVNDLIIVEIKSVEHLLAVHEAQLLSYLKLSDKSLGLLINFNTRILSRSVRRIANGL
jgi:GxxExxY protein